MAFINIHRRSPIITLWSYSLPISKICSPGQGDGGRAGKSCGRWCPPCLWGRDECHLWQSSSQAPWFLEDWTICKDTRLAYDDGITCLLRRPWSHPVYGIFRGPRLLQIRCLCCVYQRRLWRATAVVVDPEGILPAASSPPLVRRLGIINYWTPMI